MNWSCKGVMNFIIRNNLQTMRRIEESKHDVGRIIEKLLEGRGSLLEEDVRMLCIKSRQIFLE